jgi:hypothetical protein
MGRTHGRGMECGHCKRYRTLVVLVIVVMVVTMTAHGEPGISEAIALITATVSLLGLLLPRPQAAGIAT